MNTKRIASFVVVALLLAALPGMTAVLAQDSQPPPIVISPIEEDGPILVVPAQLAGPGAVDWMPLPPKDAAGVYVPSETAALSANKSEAEPNNSNNTANRMAVGDVMSGKIKGKGDVDYYRVDVSGRTSVLIDIDAQVNGSNLDAVVCLYDRNMTLRACNDDAEGYDSLLFQFLLPPPLWPGTPTDGSPYYIRVQDYNHPNEGGDTYAYKLAVYRPLLVSATTSGNVAGIAFDKADVLAHYDFPGGVERWKMFFDASDVGVTSNVAGLSANEHSWSGIEIVLQGPQSLTVQDSRQTVTPFDIVDFEGYQFGPNTSGAFRWGYRYGFIGLTKSSEKLDALAWPELFSTIGAATFNGGDTVADEDLSILNLEEDANLFFDGSQVRGLGARNVSSADILGGLNPSTTFFLTINGSGVIDGNSVNQKDIFTVSWPAYRVTGIAWRGGAHHFPYNIDAFDIAD